MFAESRPQVHAEWRKKGNVVLRTGKCTLHWVAEGGRVGKGKLNYELLRPLHSSYSWKKRSSTPAQSDEIVCNMRVRTRAHMV